ncbi:terminase small subunit [Desulfovibrio piger]|uniref:terminase small subunit n=1 Tax=Desulfovibrio piger TaxID=901 RepID=UPI0026E9A741|nr:terminase small subunit [Desulfovibrio piger]
MPKLTDKQKEFVRQYLVDLNATQAAVRAGYSVKTAYRQGADLLQKTSIREAIEKAQAKRARRVEVTQDYVLSNLVEVVERTMQRAPVTNRKGEQVTDEEGRAVWTFDAKGANRALELLGKHLGIFTDKIRAEVSGPDGGPVASEIVVRFVEPGGEQSGEAGDGR